MTERPITGEYLYELWRAFHPDAHPPWERVPFLTRSAWESVAQTVTEQHITHARRR